jgi:hypothetical protein
MTMPICSSPKTASRSRPGAPLQPAGLARDEAIARATACEFLVRSCEDALFDLRCALGEATDPQEVRAGLRAIELLQEVLEGWRETSAMAATETLRDRQRLRHVHRR